MNPDLLGPLMFGVVFLLIFSGYPVAFSLGGTALIFAAIGVSLDIFQWSLMYAFPERVFGIMSNYVLLAVPFFIFMGTMLEKSKLAEDLLTTIGALFGGMRGGLALAVVFVGALLAAATGVVGASVVAMGSSPCPSCATATPLAQHWCDCSQRNPRSDHSAERGADCPGGPARHQRGRSIHRISGSRGDARDDVCALRHGGGLVQA